jgi:hypothetical protein
MSICGETDFREDFRQELWRLRLAINTVPEERRPPLRQLASQIEQRQRRIENDCARACQQADDLSLNLASVSFGVWACKNEAEQILAKITQRAD